MVYGSKPCNELKTVGVIKLKIVKPSVDSKSNNAQPKVHVVDTSSQFITKNYKEQVNWLIGSLMFYCCLSLFKIMVTVHIFFLLCCTALIEFNQAILSLISS
jgi:hypothetical protein